MTNNKKTNKKETGHSFSKGLITGLTAASAALAIFLYSTKEGKKEREKLKGWMISMKGEIIHKLEKTKDVSKENYNKIVDDVSKKFGKTKDISSGEVVALSKFLKSRWEVIKKEANKNKK